MHSDTQTVWFDVLEELPMQIVTQNEFGSCGCWSYWKNNQTINEL